MDSLRRQAAREAAKGAPREAGARRKWRHRALHELRRGSREVTTTCEALTRLLQAQARAAHTELKQLVRQAILDCKDTTPGVDFVSVEGALRTMLAKSQARVAQEDAPVPAETKHASLLEGAARLLTGHQIRAPGGGGAGPVGSSVDMPRGRDSRYFLAVGMPKAVL